tara:strand:+ start:407 stop:793 length:387 start_codon:yes stop_codon:yes gene_type:complete
MNVLRAETHKFHFCLGLAQREPTLPHLSGIHRAKETTNEDGFLQGPKIENIGLLVYENLRKHKVKATKDTQMNKKRITISIPEGLIIMLDQELSVWETSTSSQIQLVLRDWVGKVIERRNQPSSNGGE